jgi:nitroimidazol reductase NimA-like FMN-containing flavoprotein (pyridoxamine 5'-phosphate oxidase superfamily)
MQSEPQRGSHPEPAPARPPVHPEPGSLIRELNRAESEAVLARNHVGRIAYSFRDRVDIEPIHYVYHDGWIYGRTQPGTKLTVVQHNYWVAFEVDEVEDIFGWRSVVVRGGFYILADEGTPQSRALREQAIVQVRRLVPAAFTPQDPVPFRDILFRIAVQELEGRTTFSEGDGTTKKSA